MEIQYENEPKQIQAKTTFRIWLFLATGGALIAGVWLFFQGIQFNSTYSFIYIGIGLMTILYGMVTFPMAFRVFTRKGKIVLTVTKGEQGQIISNKKSVYLKDIRDIEMRHHRYSIGGVFFEDILIRTYQNKLVRLRTYNMIADPHLKDLVENHMFPYMTEDARENWQKKVNK